MKSLMLNDKPIDSMYKKKSLNKDIMNVLYFLKRNFLSITYYGLLPKHMNDSNSLINLEHTKFFVYVAIFKI